MQRQVSIELYPNLKTSQGVIRAIKYIADFVYFENGKKIVVDAKGYETSEFKIKKKLLLWRYPDIVFVERKKGKPEKRYERRT